MTEHEYWAEVTGIAEGANEGAKEQGVSVDQYLCEYVDAHMYVIYTFEARQVLLHSKNEDAIFDVLGEQTIDCLTNFYSKAAYFAFLADIQDRMTRLES
jgi:hypothetical protein